MKGNLKIKFPYSRPYIDSKDITSVKNVLERGYLTQGEKLVSFENLLKKTFKSKYALACNSGTAALHMIYMALNVGPNRAVLTSPITFLATANAAKMCKAKVYFTDVNKDSGCMDPDSAEEVLKKHPDISVIAVVHLCGRIANMEALSILAKKYNCKIVEDACHAPGSYFKNKRGKNVHTGSCNYSVASSFSFHAIKHIAVGEGGCVTTNDIELYSKIKKYRSHGMIKESNNIWEYNMSELGWNYRLDEISCALGITQISKLKEGIKYRRQLVQYYKEFLKEYDFIKLPEEPIDKNSHSWHLFSILVNFKEIKIGRVEVMKKLATYGIGSQVHYKPLFLQPYYSNAKKLVNALDYYNKTLSLPLYYGLKKENIKFICNKLVNILGLK